LARRFRGDYRDGLALAVGLTAIFATDPTLPLPAPFPFADTLALCAIALTAYAGTFLALPAPGNLMLYCIARRVRGTPEQQERVARTLLDARPVLARIRDAAARLEPALADDTRALAARADAMLDALAQSPSDLRRSRRLLAYYLPEFAELTERYAALADKRRQAGQDASDVLEKYRLVLDDMHRLLAQQAERNLSNDLLHLDVRLDVLRKSVSFEGV